MKIRPKFFVDVEINDVVVVFMIKSLSPVIGQLYIFDELYTQSL